MNFLEELAAEWYEFQGFLLWRNKKVGKLKKGGWEGELDIVALHPTDRLLVHVEASTDAWTWKKRDEVFSRKFSLGRRFIPQFLAGLDAPREIESIALLGYSSKSPPQTLGGGRVVRVQDLLSDMVRTLESHHPYSSAIPEQLPLLRTVQYVTAFRAEIYSGKN